VECVDAIITQQTMGTHGKFEAEVYGKKSCVPRDDHADLVEWTSAK